MKIKLILSLTFMFVCNTGIVISSSYAEDGKYNPLLQKLFSVSFEAKKCKNNSPQACARKMIKASNDAFNANEKKIIIKKSIYLLEKVFRQKEKNINSKGKILIIGNKIRWYESNKEKSPANKVWKAATDGAGKVKLTPKGKKWKKGKKYKKGKKWKKW